MPALRLCPQCQTPIPSKDTQFCYTCNLPCMSIAGKYVFQRQLGKGGLGVLYLAEHAGMTMDRQRAIKVVRPEYLSDPLLKRRMRQEIEVTSLLSRQSQHIVQVYDDFGEEPGLGFYYIMEFLKGQTLREVLHRLRRFPLSDALHIFSQLCKAMEACHQRGIIHRDLKPENLFLLERGDNPLFVKVIDFGITRILVEKDQTRLTQGALGTPFYMAPEQWNNGTADAKTDLYAMGLILYEMISGKLPFHFDEPSVMTIAMAHLSHPPLPFTSTIPALDVPAPIEAAILSSLAKNPADRPASARAFWELLAPSAPPFVPSATFSTDLSPLAFSETSLPSPVNLPQTPVPTPSSQRHSSRGAATPAPSLFSKPSFLIGFSFAAFLLIFGGLLLVLRGDLKTPPPAPALRPLQTSVPPRPSAPPSPSLPLPPQALSQTPGDPIPQTPPSPPSPPHSPPTRPPSEALNPLEPLTSPATPDSPPSPNPLLPKKAPLQRKAPLSKKVSLKEELRRFAHTFDQMKREIRERGAETLFAARLPPFEKESEKFAKYKQLFSAFEKLPTPHNKCGILGQRELHRRFSRLAGAYRGYSVSRLNLKAGQKFGDLADSLDASARRFHRALKGTSVQSLCFPKDSSPH